MATASHTKYYIVYLRLGTAVHNVGSDGGSSLWKESSSVSLSTVIEGSIKIEVPEDWPLSLTKYTWSPKSSELDFERQTDTHYGPQGHYSHQNVISRQMFHHLDFLLATSGYNSPLANGQGEPCLSILAVSKDSLPVAASADFIRTLEH